MKIIDLDENNDMISFAKEASDFFKNHDEKYSTYTRSEIERGCFFAVKFGITERDVLVLKLDENIEPTLFTGIQ